MTRTFRLGMLLPVLLLVGLVGCGSSGAQEQRTSITVFAAASLRNTFPEIGEKFTTDNQGASVEFTFAGSADLVTRLAQATAKMLSRAGFGKP